MDKFSDKAIAYMGSNVIDSILHVIMGMLMVRYLIKYDYGTFRQIMLVAVLVSTTLAIGLPQSLSYFIPRANTAGEKKQLAFQVFIALTLLGLLAAAVCYMLRFKISTGFNNPDLLQYSWIYSLFFMFLLPSKCTQATLIALKKTHFASLLNAGTAIFTFLFIIIPLILGKGLKVILISMLSVYFFKFILVTCIIISLEGSILTLLDIPSIKAQLIYSIPLGASVLVGVMRRYIDQFIIAAFYNPENFAVYSRGAFELPFVAILPYTLSTLIVPEIASSYKEGRFSNIIYMWQQSMWKLSLLFFPLFIYTFSFADNIITVLFTSNYLDSVPIFRIYLVLLPIRIVAYRTILQATGQTKPIFEAVVISLGVSVILGIVFERIFGITGPAMAIVSGELVSACYLLWKTKISMDFRFFDLIPLRKIYRPFLCSIIVGIFILPLKLMVLPDIVLILISGTLFFGIYVFIMRWFNFFTDNDWDLICRWATLRVLRTK